MRPLVAVSWNVLADCYSFGMTSRPAVSLPALDFATRSRIMTEIFTNLVREHDLGLCMLQEVDHWQDFYEPMLSSLGLSSVYLQRPLREDGCAISFDPKRLNLLAIDQVQFDDLVKEGGSLFERNNVGLMVKFSIVDKPDICFAASSSHLYWNPNRPQVKVIYYIFFID